MYSTTQHISAFTNEPKTITPVPVRACKSQNSKAKDWTLQHITIYDTIKENKTVQLNRENNNKRQESTQHYKTLQALTRAGDITRRNENNGKGKDGNI